MTWPEGICVLREPPELPLLGLVFAETGWEVSSETFPFGNLARCLNHHSDNRRESGNRAFLQTFKTRDSLAQEFAKLLPRQNAAPFSRLIQTSLRAFDRCIFEAVS